MLIQVQRVTDNKKEKLEISKCASIELVKESISEIFDVPIDKQRLFFRGKQLENEYKLFDYGVNLNDMILLMVKEDVNDSEPRKEDTISSGTINDATAIDYSLVRPNDIQYYKVGDLVDYYIADQDIWKNGRIKLINIPSDNFHLIEESGFTSNATFDVSDLKSRQVYNLSSSDIVPYLKLQIPFQYLKVKDEIMVNYNMKNPEFRGVWYSAIITSVGASSLKATLKTFVDGKYVDVEDCNIRREIFFHALNRFEYPEQSDLEKTMDQYKDFNCSRCKNNPAKKCRQCGCVVCGGKTDEDQLILCDECDDSYHLWCVDPPLVAVPEDDWYCQQCRNDENEIVKAGEGLKFSKKRLQMKSVTGETTRDWGKGMACVGRTKVCSIVPSNHFGPVPGVEVGTCWKFRIQVSEAGIHRPHVAGIHGRHDEGAYSIVLSGGYEDDIDSGDTFIYTGSGGRDLSGNKRTAEQSCNQELTRNNLALALNCNAKIDNIKGAVAKDWRKGKPVRVVRNHKVTKHSKYGPADGNRYDGIYKVVKYYPVKGKSGFIVWRYEFRRDDPTPAPWTKEGKKLIEEHGLNEVICPEGYEEKQKPEKGSKKRVLTETTTTPNNNTNKKQKTGPYKISKEVEKLINGDSNNRKLWDQLVVTISDGKQKFLNEVQSAFECICCQELANNPVSTPCGHIFCKDCLNRSFKADIYSCPTCRHDLTSKFEMAVNLKLQAILNGLFPGYASGR